MAGAPGLTRFSFVQADVVACGSTLLPPRDPSLPPCQNLTNIYQYLTNKYYGELAILHDVYTDPPASLSPWAAYSADASPLSTRTLELQTLDIVMTNTFKSQVYVQAYSVERDSNWCNRLL